MKKNNISFSLIIPVYNRPDEIEELLQSIENQDFTGDFEVLIIEDGSTIICEKIVHSFSEKININYFFKENSGPGDSRNYGMKQAKGNYFIILDSDCLLPPFYLEAVNDFLEEHFFDCYGGADAATEDFSPIQKAINYAMTSFFTTGGIRGSEKIVTRFEPRSFNMGISKEAFEKTGGFGNIHPGEDPDLSIRLWKAGFKTTFIPTAFVYHKRRISWEKFRKQVKKFGQTRPILNFWHPEYKKIVYFFPTLFSLGLFLATFLLFLGYESLFFAYFCYFLIVFVDSFRLYKRFLIAIYAVYAVFLQFTTYGIAFLYASLKIKFSKKKLEILFPHLFFN